MPRATGRRRPRRARARTTPAVERRRPPRRPGPAAGRRPARVARLQRANPKPEADEAGGNGNTGQGPYEHAYPRCRRPLQDRRAVILHQVGADLRLAAALGQPLLDQPFYLDRLRRVGSGHRLPGAHRAPVLAGHGHGALVEGERVRRSRRRTHRRRERPRHRRRRQWRPKRHLASRAPATLWPGPLPAMRGAVVALRAPIRRPPGSGPWPHLGAATSPARTPSPRRGRRRRRSLPERPGTRTAGR